MLVQKVRLGESINTVNALQKRSNFRTFGSAPEGRDRVWERGIEREVEREVEDGVLERKERVEELKNEKVCTEVEERVCGNRVEE